MTIADTSMETIGNLFYSRIRSASLSAGRKKAMHRNELARALGLHAPEPYGKL